MRLFCSLLRCAHAARHCHAHSPPLMALPQFTAPRAPRAPPRPSRPTGLAPTPILYVSCFLLAEATSCALCAPSQTAPVAELRSHPSPPTSVISEGCTSLFNQLNRVPPLSVSGSDPPLSVSGSDPYPSDLPSDPDDPLMAEEGEEGRPSVPFQSHTEPTPLLLRPFRPLSPPMSGGMPPPPLHMLPVASVVAQAPPLPVGQDDARGAAVDEKEGGKCACASEEEQERRAKSGSGELNTRAARRRRQRAKLAQARREQGDTLEAVPRAASGMDNEVQPQPATHSVSPNSSTPSTTAHPHPLPPQALPIPHSLPVQHSLPAPHSLPLHPLPHAYCYPPPHAYCYPDMYNSQLSPSSSNQHYMSYQH
jgi:hypothetical protein